MRVSRIARRIALTAGERATSMGRVPPRDLACVALLAALFLLVGLPQHRNGLEPGDEGYFAYGAVRVLEGQIPNRDFVTYQPPLAYYSIAGLFRCFGISIGAMRTLGLAF